MALILHPHRSLDLGYFPREWDGEPDIDPEIPRGALLNGHLFHRFSQYANVSGWDYRRGPYQQGLFQQGPCPP